VELRGVCSKSWHRGKIEGGLELVTVEVVVPFGYQQNSGSGHYPRLGEYKRGELSDTEETSQHHSRKG
jgi:hypothetical protein